MAENVTIDMLKPSITFGNKKIGNMWSFSLPSYITCPGASEWCRKMCYAAKYEKYRAPCRKAYIRNLAASLIPEYFIPKVLEMLPEDDPYLRLHVSGDFYSPEYIKTWYTICEQRPKMRFWGFTRSWTQKLLLEELNKLRELPNVELIGSTDPGMSLPPDDWRIAYIETDKRAEGLNCPQQNKKIDSCRTCKHCFNGKSKSSVIFKIH